MGSLAYQYHRLQRLAVAKIAGYRETNGSFVQQEKRWSTLKQVFHVSGQGSAIIQMTIYTCSTLQAAGPGPNSASPDWTTVRTDGLLTGFIVTRPDQCLERQ